jgi:hypothetical protein
MDSSSILYSATLLVFGLFVVVHFGKRDIDIEFLGIVIHLKGK